MKITLKNLGSLFFFLFCMPPLSFSQDTLKIFRFPPIDQVDVIVNARVTFDQGKLRYEYEIKSLPTSKQDVSTFDIPFDLAPSNIRFPQGWAADAGGGVPRTTWWSRDSVYRIRPNEVLSGFGYDSEGLPRIMVMYVGGWAEPPELTFEPDSTVGEDVLEASKKVLTVAAAKPPSPFVPLVFLDTLISYKHQARALGWIDNDGIVASLDQKLENAKAQLQRGNTRATRNILEAFVNEVEAQNRKHLTSEAYALLKFNAEYLISKL